MFIRILIALIIVIVGLALYVRLAPTDPARWHQPLTAAEPFDRQDEGGFAAARQMTAPAADVLQRLQETALATPRTTLVAGSVADGLMTFQTRSALWGFPDYTTVGVDGDLLVIHGRLRFGRSDMGVNKLRVMAWLAGVADLTAPL